MAAVSTNPLHIIPILLWLTCLGILQLKAKTYLGQNPCISKTNCHECIQTPSCAWCYEPPSEFGDQPRCYQPVGNQLHKGCKKDFEYFPNNEFIVTSRKALSKGYAEEGDAAAIGMGDGGGAWAAGGSASSSSSSSSSGSFSGSFGESSSEIVQVSPQRVQMKLRARESYSFHVFYTQAKDYPVDLYYLMDLSRSMEDDKDKLSNLGYLLAESMRNITSEFQLGFGSFVDKVVMPYVSTVPSKLLMPCTNCAAPYGYKNHLSLSKDITKFSQMVKSAEVSGNLDAPEGGLDAIMQAVVCKDQIGWRDNARRLLVVATDDGFHYAGDGKLGGITKSNDGRCHLENGYYTESIMQDYPSISQLNRKIKQHSINVIFAVTEEQTGVYKQLVDHIEAASTGVLAGDSSNIVELVKEQYRLISSSVEMRDNATAGVEIRYYSRCNTSSGPEINTSACNNFKIGQVIDFRLEVFLKECPQDPKERHQTIQVYPVGLSESVFIDLEMLCSCPCEHSGDPGYKENAAECSGVGTYKCGICECDPPYTGKRCDCALDTYFYHNDTPGCKPPGSTETVECSGQGVCLCNQCECNTRDNVSEVIYGRWCECDNFSCYRHDGQICGGHGICDCGECMCEAPWTGKACECYSATNICFPPFKEDPQLCDGHGDCICGICQCQVTPEGRYTGRYCERCPNCTETCDALKPCVLCQMYHVGPYDDDTCVKMCQNFTPVEVQVVQADDDNDEFLCAGYDEDDCKHVFVYKHVNQTHYIVKAQMERECPSQ